MGFDNLSSNKCEGGELEEREGQGVCLCDSFVVDIKAHSRINRNISRNGSVSGGGGAGEKIINPTAAADQRNENPNPNPNPPTAATLHGGRSTPEKPVVVALAATDQSKPHYHQITIRNSSPAAETKPVDRKNRFSFQHSPPARFTDPRRILLFFATLSSIGSILLIYFTLSMGKLNGDDSVLN